MGRDAERTRSRNQQHPFAVLFDLAGELLDYAVTEYNFRKPGERESWNIHR